MTAWPTVYLHEVAMIDRTGVAPSDIADGTLYVGLEHIETGGRLLDIKPVANGDLASSKFRFTPKHVLYGKLRPYLAKIATPDFSGVCSTDILPIMPGARLDRSYLTHFLRQPSMVDYATSRSEGANLPRLSPKALAEFEIPLPPLDEQRRIAAILDQADALRRARNRATELLDNLSVSLFYEAFVLGERSTWPMVSVDDIATDIRTGPFGSQLLHSEFVDDGVAVLGIDNAVTNEFAWDRRRFITPEKYQKLKRFTVRPGDVLITIMGTCGRCAVVPEDIPTAINTKHLCCITLDRSKALPGFLQAAFLNHPDILKQLGVQAKGAVMPGLNMGIIKSLSLRLPPLDIQSDFVGKLAAAKELQSIFRRSDEALAGLFASLRQRAFRRGLS